MRQFTFSSNWYSSYERNGTDSKEVEFYIRPGLYLVYTVLLVAGNTCIPAVGYDDYIGRYSPAFKHMFVKALYNLPKVEVFFALGE